MSLTSDPNDPRLTHGADTEPTDQAPVYLVLSEEERAKGFVRPLRRSYVHVGLPGPQYPLRDLTEDEKASRPHYVKYEAYPPDPDRASVGRFWTAEQLAAVGKGCGVVTTMGLPLCETYARRPDFYGSTYCVGCRMHRPVAEFRWDEDGQVVGS